MSYVAYDTWYMYICVGLQNYFCLSLLSSGHKIDYIYKCQKFGLDDKIWFWRGVLIWRKNALLYTKMKGNEISHVFVLGGMQNGNSGAWNWNLKPLFN